MHVGGDRFTSGIVRLSRIICTTRHSPQAKKKARATVVLGWSPTLPVDKDGGYRTITLCHHCGAAGAAPRLTAHAYCQERAAAAIFAAPADMV